MRKKKWIGSLLCAAALVFLIYIHSDEQRLRDFENWMNSFADVASNK
ncbi:MULTISPECIES: hypothetical protein [unclassified Mesorhizobium]|nr:MULTISPECIES: hypothetical protein [unclassified Mesorhizobium]